MTALDKLRVEIDKIDDEIVSLLSARADLVLEVKKTKKEENIDIYSSSRERQIIDRVMAIAKKGNFPLGQLERIFINIIGASRSLIGDLSVSYLVSEGSSALDAARKQFGEAVEFSPEGSAAGMISKIEQGQPHFGVLPIVTALGGFCFKTIELLKDSKLSIIAEIEIDQARYIVVGDSTPPETGNDKTSILCSAEEGAGVLRDLLEPFSNRSITLMKIESRPTNESASQYLFYFDLLGHRSQQVIIDAIEELSERSIFVKVLGSYPHVSSHEK